MREIKFRFWDGTSGNMCMAHTAEDGYITYRSGWKLSMQQAIAESNATEGYNKPKALMQYTGLKDKNGKEIYEGDVVRVSEYWSGDHRVAEHTSAVRYDYNSFDTDQLDFDNFERGDVEVIGNIYENPELLTKENK